MDSRQLAEAVLADVFDTVLVSDDEGRLVYVCPNVAYNFGLSKEEVEASGHVDELLGPAAFDRAAFEARGLVENVEWPVTRPDGQPRHLLVHVKRVALGAGTRLYTCRDVTERERELRVQRRFFDDSLNLLCVCGFDGRFHRLNPRWNVVFGYDDEELYARPFLDFVHPEDRERTQREIERVAGGATVSGFELRARHADGSYRWVRWNASPALEEDAFYASGDDITDRKRLELRHLAQNAVARISSTATSLDAAAPELLSELRTCFSAATAELWQWRPDEQALRRTAVDHASSRDLEAWDAASVGLAFPSGEGFPGRVLREGRVLEVADTLADPNCIRREVGAEAGMQSAIGIPVVVADAVEAVILLAFAYHRPLDETIRDTLTAIGQQIGHFVHRSRVQAELIVMRQAVESITEGVLITNPRKDDNPLVYVNPAFERITGYGRDEATGRNCRFMQGPGTDPDARARIREAVGEARAVSQEILNYRSDGTSFWNELSISPLRDDAGELTHFVGVARDVTDEKRRAEREMQRQKMESIGLLAGGVAHDFNNMLTVILGYGEVLSDEPDLDESAREMAREIYDAGERARDLTEQLLAFSRKQVLQPVVVDLNQHLAAVERLIARLIGEDVVLVTRTAAEPLRIRVDGTQLTQIVMNLAVNARDAMPTGGRLLIESRSAELDESYAHQHSEVTPGRYVQLAVTDSGKGMPEAVRRHVFEPFFTTKERGKGTGMGLSTVYGIVKQSGGHVTVYSEPGHGTCIKVYLPRIDEFEEESSHDHRGPARIRGCESVLLVEDEAPVREAARVFLERHGYRVLVAETPEVAIEIVSDPNVSFDLLLTDVVMPGSSGAEVADRVRSLRPDAKVLFMSGYTDSHVVHHGIVDEGTNFLQKPFTANSLSREVRRVLDDA